MAALSIVVRAFGFQFSHQLIGALMKRAHPRIFPGALKRVLLDHDDRLIEHVVQLVLVERCGHDRSVAQRDACLSSSYSQPTRHTGVVVRARVALVLIALGLVLVAVFVGASAGARSGGSRAATWGSLQVLAPASQYAFDSQLAVAENGQTLAGWFGGSRPHIPVGCKAMVCPHATPWGGSDVVLDPGTVDRGFGTPVVVSTHGSDGPEGLQLAISGTGVAYAAWEQKSGPWMISSATSGGAFTVPHKLLPGGGQLSSLVRSPAGPVAAVWFAWAGETSQLRYALLRPDGRLGRTITVGRWNGSVEGTPFALNDRGEFAAVDMVGQSEEGPVPPAPLVHICNAAGHCSRPHELHFGHIPSGADGADENQAIALSNDGTVTVLASFSKLPKHPAPNTPLGLWAAVRRPGRRWSAPQKISNGGEFPLAASDGNSSAVAVFQHVCTPKLRWLGDRIETSVLHASGTSFAAPDLVRGAEAPNPVALATTMSGGLLVAWVNSGDIVGGEPIEPGVYVLTGSATDPGAPQLIAGGSIGDETPAVGIDREGDAVVLWDESSESGTQGVFASTHHAG